MSNSVLKLAKDLKPGDRIVVTLPEDRNRQDSVTVLGVMPYVQTIERPMLRLTLRTSDNRDIERRYPEHHAARMAT